MYLPDGCFRIGVGSSEDSLTSRWLPRNRSGRFAAYCVQRVTTLFRASAHCPPRFRTQKHPLGLHAGGWLSSEEHNCGRWRSCSRSKKPELEQTCPKHQRCRCQQYCEHAFHQLPRKRADRTHRVAGEEGAADSAGISDPICELCQSHNEPRVT